MMRLLRRIFLGVMCSVGMLGAQAQTAAHGAKTDAPVHVPTKEMGDYLLTTVKPVYPAAAKAKRIEGIIVLHVLIGKDGHVQTLVATSGPDELREAATTAVSQWIYTPYLVNGEAVPVDTTVVVNFHIGPT